MEKKKVILQVLPALVSGGVERGTIDIAKTIKEAGYESLVVSSGGPMVGQLAIAGIKHINLPLKSKNPLVILLNSWRLKRIIKKYSVDIVHARSRAPAWSAYLATRKNPKCHFITTWHGVYSFKSKMKNCYNKVMAKGEKVIAVSDFIKEHIVDNYEVNPDKIKVIHRGVDLKKFTKEKVNTERLSLVAGYLFMDHDRPVILLPARITQWKGHLFLLDALALIKDLPFFCLFVGKADAHNNYNKKIREKIAELELEKQVLISDQLSDMPALYSLSDIVVSASIRPEAFGRVVTEAQAMERLVVATKHGGACETVIDKKTGFLVEPDNIEEMAKVLRKMLEIAPEERAKIVAAARENIVKNFSLEKMQKETLEVYGSFF